MVGCHSSRKVTKHKPMHKLYFKTKVLLFLKRARKKKSNNFSEATFVFFILFSRQTHQYLESTVALEIKQNKICRVMLILQLATHELTILAWIVNVPKSPCVRGLVPRMVLQRGGSPVERSQLTGGVIWNYETAPSPFPLLFPVHEKRSSLLLPSPCHGNCHQSRIQISTTVRQNSAFVIIFNLVIQVHKKICIISSQETKVQVNKES